MVPRLLKLERLNTLTALLAKKKEGRTGCKRTSPVSRRYAYNSYAKLPAGGAALALPLLEKAVRYVELDAGDQAVIIADYGSSQGKNSMVPMHIAIRGLRKRLGPTLRVPR